MLRRLLAKSRLEAGAAAPAAGAAPVPESELRARLEALGADNGPVALAPEPDGRLRITWQLHGIPYATLLFRAKLRETHAIVLRFEPAEGAVLAKLLAGRVRWETAAATWMPKAAVTWREPALPDFGRPGPEPAITPETPRTAQALCDLVRAQVTRAGWRFRPVV